MSTESLPIYDPPEGSDFVDISDVFLDAAQGMLVTRLGSIQTYRHIYA